MTIHVNFAVRSETGSVRKNNEDNFFCNGIYMTPSERDRPFFMNGTAETPGIFAVFDGMGGHDCGELASLTAAETLAENSEKIRRGGSEDIERFVRNANDKLIDIMTEKGVITGTTLAMIVTGKKSFTAYNLGDSRIYRVKDGYLTRVNEDHTVAEEMVREGRLTPKQAEHHPMSNMLTRFIGRRDDYFALKPDVYGEFEYEDNGRALICSDGLNKMLSHREINVIMREAGSASEAVNGLTDEALRKGGYDNVTCIVLEFVN